MMKQSALTSNSALLADGDQMIWSFGLNRRHKCDDLLSFLISYWCTSLSSFYNTKHMFDCCVLCFLFASYVLYMKMVTIMVTQYKHRMVKM
jgi:hypothetical protein